MKIKIIRPVNSSQFDRAIERSVREVAAPDMTFDVEHLPAGTPVIESRLHLAINAPHVAEAARRAERDGFDGIFINDMDMCGLGAAREVVDIPVVGGYQPSAFTAMMIAERFSIVTVVDSVVAMQREHAKTFGISQNLASVRAVDIPVGALIDEQTAIDRVYEASLDAVRKDGAHAIILGCTSFIGVAAEVTRRLALAGAPAPVIDPNHAAVGYLELLIRNKKAQSRMSYVKMSG